MNKLETQHKIIQALIMRAIKNIMVKKYKIQIPNEIIEEVSEVVTEDIMFVNDVYKNIK